MVRIHLLRVCLYDPFFCPTASPGTSPTKKWHAVHTSNRCSMWGSNPRPLAHKTNTLPTELMEHVCRTKVQRSATGSHTAFVV